MVCLQGDTKHLVLTIISENLRSIPTVYNRGWPASKFQRGQPNFLKPHSKPGQVLASREKEFPPFEVREREICQKQPRLRLGQETTCLLLPFLRHLVWSGLPKAEDRPGEPDSHSKLFSPLSQAGWRRDPGSISQGRGLSSATWRKSLSI